MQVGHVMQDSLASVCWGAVYWWGLGKTVRFVADYAAATLCACQCEAGLSSSLHMTASCLDRVATISLRQLCTSVCVVWPCAT